MKLLCQPGKTFISCKNRHVLGGQKPKMGKQVVVPKWKIKLWIPSIWRGKLPWHIFVVVVAKYHYWEWSFCDTHNFLFFPFSKEHLKSYGKRKANVKDTPSGFLGGVEGTLYNGRDFRSFFLNAPQQFWGWLSSSLPTPQGAGNSIN